jgi:2-polyprenyl-3-methyl-5-hydroxy-6-metoxy-1,4-benzoquinol methylase
METTQYLEKTFEDIYTNGIWNDKKKDIPLSGPGSSIKNTINIVLFLDNFIYNNNIKNLLDLGCGDLTWTINTKYFNDDNIIYTGVDIVNSLIEKHSLNYPSKKFMKKNIITLSNSENYDLIIIRDVLFHLTNEQILEIFKNFKNKFKFIAITSCKNEINNNSFDEYCYSSKNIHKSPFNINKNFLLSCNEEKFNRNFYIYTHEQFYS